MVKTLVDHAENIGLCAGVVVAERAQIFIGLEGVTFAAQKVAEQDEAAGEPVVVGRVGVDEFVDCIKRFGILLFVGIVRCEVERAL